MQRAVQVAAIQALRHTDDDALLARFAGRGDEAAFAVLVDRHGPMVHGVCCRVLGNAQDAEDAFQATFLVLATKAAKVRPGSCVAGWLHGVACRVSANLRRETARRVRRERAAGERRPAAEAALTWHEAWSVLDEELHRLPDRFRLPLILCYLEGRTRDEAARRLGLRVGTLHGRLQRGRDVLRDRLTRRGVTLPAALLVSAVLAPGAQAALSPTLILSTTKAAAAYAAGVQGAAGIVPASVAALAAGASTPMIPTYLRLAAVVIAFGMAAVGWALQGNPGRGGALPAKRPGAPQRLGADNLRHRDGVHGVAFSPDGKTLLSAGADQQFRVWDAATGRERARISTGDQFVKVAAFSRDGKTVAAGGAVWVGGRFRTAAIAVWDVASGRRVFRTEDPGRALPTSLALSPDGRTVAMADGDSEVIRRWDLATGKALDSFRAPGPEIRLIAFSSDGKTLVAGGRAATYVLDVAGGTRFTVTDPPGWAGGTFALSPDGRLLATQSGAAVIRLTDVTTGKTVKSLEAPSRLYARVLAFTADGKTLAAGETDGAILWDLDSGKPRRLAGFCGDVESLAFSPDGTALAAAGRANAAVVLWDVKTGEDRMAKAYGHRSAVEALFYSPDGRTLVTSGADRTLRVWDTETGRERQVLRIGGAAALGVALSADGRTVAAGGSDGLIRLWEVAAAKEVCRIEARGLAGGPLFLGFAAKAEKLVGVLGGDRLLITWDAAKGAETARLSPFGVPKAPGGPLGEQLAIRSAAFSADATRCVVTAGDDIRYLDVATGKTLRVIEGSGPNWVQTLALSPDGRLLAAGVGTATYELGLWQLDIGRKVGSVPIGGTFEHVTAAAFSADGRYVAAASGFGRAVVVCEVASGKEVLTLRGHESFVNALAFSPDGRRLAAGLRDTTVFVWDLASEAAPVGGTPRSAWDALGADGPAAYRARWALLPRPAESVPFLGKNLRPVTTPDGERVSRVIAELDSDSFAAREKATDDLGQLGELAAPALRAALAGKPSPEARRRLTRLVDRINAGPSADTLRALRSVAILETVGTKDARLVLETLAKGAPGAHLTRGAKEALERLAARR